MVYLCLSLFGSNLNPLQVQTKQEELAYEWIWEEEFQSPIGTNKTVFLRRFLWIEYLVSIPYRYTKNYVVYDECYYHYGCTFQSPIGTNKTLFFHFFRGLISFGFNPLQVQTKHDNREICFSPSSKFQSPIGTNKTFYALFYACIKTAVSIPYRYKQNRVLEVYVEDRSYEFQSPIGTNKTGPLAPSSQRAASVSIPYRYKQNLE